MAVISFIFTVIKNGQTFLRDLRDERERVNFDSCQFGQFQYSVVCVCGRGCELWVWVWLVRHRQAET